MKVALAVLGIIAIVGSLTAGIYAIRYYTAAPRGIVGAEETIQSAPFRIVSYNHFFDLCTVVIAHEESIEAQKRLLEQVTTTSTRERVLTNIAGLEAQRARNIEQYNQDARKDYTAGQFRDSDLPYQLNMRGTNSC